MSTAKAHFRPHPSVVFTRLDATEAVLLHLETQRYYSLNETGARLWELLHDGLTPHAIAAALQEEYTVEAAPALDAVLALVEDLHQEGLVQPQ
jgi:hypothetical protein